MSRRRGDTQVFSISFLDILSCALGGVLLLLLLNMDASRQAARKHASRAAAWETWGREMQSRVDNAVAESQRQARARQTAEREARSAAQRAERAKQEAEQAKAAQSALIGWKGPLKNIVFVFDTSTSMGTSNRFDYYKTVLKRWVENYPFEEFDVIRFSSSATAWQGNLVKATPSNRKQCSSRFIERFLPSGSTNTQEALEKALGTDGVDTIILLSDGEPNGDSEDVLEFVRDNNSRGVVINTIAMGNHEGKHRDFLARLAALTGGMFQGI